ncbi:hypothetical protein CCACVL1_24474, partial [Corchorus capsularis]
MEDGWGDGVAIRSFLAASNGGQNCRNIPPLFCPE